ncbi:MAG: thioredoxin domain-containing protein [Candidatus Pacebacteria bacterium]|nr:thioredoxin domain-containing protein [Candidatus Paceibacterota bacterium]
MKNLVILIILIGLGYFAYNAFNNSETITESGSREQIAQEDGLEDIRDDLPQSQQGALVDLNAQIQANIDSAREAVSNAQVSINTAIEEGITDLAETNVETEVDAEANAGPGDFVKYEDITLASLEGDIVLDFYASWCPSCRRLENDINDSLSDIPSNLTIVQVDYDTETALKNKYAVTKQHTMVQVDNQGNLIKKWSGGSTLESIVDEVK